MIASEISQEFSTLSSNATYLDFLSDYLPEGSGIYVQPLTGFVTSERSMTAEMVVKYWSEKIFPDSNPESYSAYFPFAQSRLLYVVETVARFLGLNQLSRSRWGDFATGEGVMLELLKRSYPNVEVYATEHSSELAQQLEKKGYQVANRALGLSEKIDYWPELNVSTLTWTLANAIDPLAVLGDVVEQTALNGYVCVAESSRILVPFRKSLSDYFSKSTPADLHPSNFSANTLKCAMQLVGLEICYVNRFFDSDVLLVIGRKTGRSIQPSLVDDKNQVVTFFKEWHQQTRYFESMRPKQH